MELKKPKVSYMDGPITAIATAMVVVVVLIMMCGFSSAIVIREIGSAIETAQCHNTP